MSRKTGAPAQPGRTGRSPPHGRRARRCRTPALLLLSALPGPAAATHYAAASPDLTGHWIGLSALALFFGSLLLATLEEFTGLRKSKPIVLSAGLIWALIAWHAGTTGNSEAAIAAARHNLLQYSELMLLMLVVMTYINALDERGVFHTLQAWTAARAFSYRQLFWFTGIASFLVSPLLDNFSTALLAGMLVIGIGRRQPRFIALGCINVVVAVNAGGVFSPFGDTTTLMVWQQNIQTTDGPLGALSFSSLVLPALVNWLLPAAAMHFAVPEGRIEPDAGPVRAKRGSIVIGLLFLATIATAVAFQGLLHLPGVIGMLTGLSYLQFFGYYLKVTHTGADRGKGETDRLTTPIPGGARQPFDVFGRIARVEWDTLLFLYGVALAVGGLGYLGYLPLASEQIYGQWGPTAANLAIGLASSVLENIPVMYAVLAMAPEMSRDQWLLATLSAGVGGSLLSIGSAAGVALMGQARNDYTFFSHLRWTPVILLGFIAGSLLLLWLGANGFRP